MTTVRRDEVHFPSGDDVCAAWLYHAVGRSGPGPVVVLAHGLTGTRRDGLGGFAEQFAAAGFAALAFDYRGFGDSTGEPDVFRPARQLDDWRAAITFARSLPQADPERIATFGSSMGGGHALAAAAVDPRVAAAISQVPFLDLVRQPFRQPVRVVLTMLSAALLGRYLPAVGRPTEAAFIAAPGAEAGWRRVVAGGEDSVWRNRVSTRWLLGRPFRPVRYARRLHCPWLVCVGAVDRVAAPGPAITAARRAPRGELRTYPGVDHFDIYDGPHHRAVVADQLDFLRRHLGGPA